MLTKAEHQHRVRPLRVLRHVVKESASWEEDSLSDQELMHAITSSKAHGMELELAELLKKLQPTEEYKRDCQRALFLLKAAMSQEFQSNFGKGPNLEIIGSSAQDTELNGADIDVACRVPGFSPDELDTKLARLWARLFTVPHSTHLAALDATRLFPHATCQFSIQLKASAQSSAPRFHAHLLLIESPPVKESLDSTLRSLCDCCGKARDLIRLVKLWARNHGLINHRDGYMNGVAWTAFVLCFLQREQYIPSLQTLAEGSQVSQTPTPSLRELLLRFFQFVCAPQAKTPRGISLMQGTDCEAAAPPSTHVGPPPPLYIQDPVQLKRGSDQNIASTLGEAQWARILDESRRVAERLDPSKPQRWFYWAEIFDPQGLASGGDKRLPKLGEVKVSGGETALPSLPTDAAHNASSAVPAVVQTVRGGYSEANHGGNSGNSRGHAQTPHASSASLLESAGRATWSGGVWPSLPGKGPAVHVPHAY